jgi:hypothetical protein
MNKTEIANKLIVSVFVTLFFSGLSSIYIAHAVNEADQENASIQSGITGTVTVPIVNTTSKPGNIAAATFFTAGAVLALLVTIMLGLQLRKAQA